MRKARYTEHQIIAVLKSVEVGRIVKDVCREAAISEANYYNCQLVMSVCLPSHFPFRHRAANSDGV